MLPPKLALFGERRVNISTVPLPYNYVALKLLGFPMKLKFRHRNSPTPRTLTTGAFHDASGGRMLISVLVTFLVVILVLYLINMLPLDGRAKQIARVVVIILGVISLLKYIAVF
jgi:uncharacterized membrane protein